MIYNMLTKQEILQLMVLFKKTATGQYYLPIPKTIISASSIEEAYYEIGHNSSECESVYEGIAYREDLYDVLISLGLSCDEAYSIMERVRKGVGYRVNFDALDIPQPLKDWCMSVQYLPSRRIVMEALKDNAKDNALINAKLRALYEEYTADFLHVWSKIFNSPAPCRMNEFGIIDIHKYDSNNGILFVGRETNGWSDDDYAAGYLFRDLMCDITQKGLSGGHIKQHPNTWYNIGRWIMLLTEPGRPITDIADAKQEAISAIGRIAFTNVNKVRGKNISSKEYFKLARNPLVKELLRKEIEIINPKIIVCGGTLRAICPLPDNFSGELYVMPYPEARENKIDMLLDLNKQMRNKERFMS